jgi:hypothetical protein
MGFSNKCVLVVVAVTVAVVAPGVSALAQLEGNVLQAGLEQIAELNAYAAAARDGYKIVEDGWHTVAGIRQGEWDLHKTYYGSLLKVSPAVKGMPEVTEIIQAAVRKKDAAALADLTVLLTDGQLSLTDGERMKRVVALRERLK